MSDNNQFVGNIGVGCMGEIPVILLNPNTFMNDSGKSIKIVCDFIIISFDYQYKIRYTIILITKLL